MSARQVAKNVIYTEGFFATLGRSLVMFCLHSCQDLQLVYSPVVFTKRLVAVALLETDSTCTNMVNSIEYRK